MPVIKINLSDKDLIMPPKYPMRIQETLNTITNLIDKGHDKMAVIMRHSDRHFHENAAMEPFMGLTENGKDVAMELGTKLPVIPHPHFYSSHFGRCIETSFLIDKGYAKQHGLFNSHNQMAIPLSPFYIKDIEKAIALVEKTGSPNFLRSWFNHEISTDIMEDPQNAAEIMTDFLKSLLQENDAPKISVCVSHDWNLFPLKEYKLGLTHEEHGSVGFLESVVVFEDQGEIMITNHQTDPRSLN